MGAGLASGDPLWQPVCLAALFAILTIQHVDNDQLARAGQLSDRDDNPYVS
jgi:hypothetical protein